MRTCFLHAALWLSALGLIDTAAAHGGQYRGPEDVVPPRGGSGRGPTVPGPRGPTTGGPPGPRIPGPAPVAGGNPITGGGNGPGGNGRGRGPVTGGITLTADLTRWDYWWEFNKDPYLRLKDALHRRSPTTTGDAFFLGPRMREEAQDRLQPTVRQIAREVVPALRAALDGSEERDIASSCMVALAKIGRNEPNAEILPLLTSRLTSRDQEVRETAALALGISQLPAALEPLENLARDNAAGRGLTGRAEVDDRTRTFALYGLGLVCWADLDVELKGRALSVFRDVLEDRDHPSRNLKVAAIHGISLLQPDRYSPDPDEQALLSDCVAALEGFYDEPLGVGEQLLQAHVPTALARLIGRDGPGAGDFKQRLVAELSGSVGGKRRNPVLAQSAALALGRLCGDAAGDADYRQALWQGFQSARDQQTRYFCLIALGQVGGTESRDRLLAVLTRKGKTLDKPWAALALGIWSHERLQESEHTDVGTVGAALRKVVREAKNPDVLAATAVALGLSRYRASADDLRVLLGKRRHQEALAGYICIGLALMEDRRSIEDLRGILTASVRRPELLRQAAVALGKLGDRTAAELLHGMLGDGEGNLAKLSAVAAALGFIGDRRSIAPLTDMLHDRELNALSRAFSAVALGGIGDKERLPWNSKIAVGINYRAAVETLTSHSLGTGILDIL